jgi:ligand-binding sensor domain-containing protein
MKVRTTLSMLCAGWMFLCIAPRQAHARWEQTKWTIGGLVQSLTVNGTTIFAGTDQLGVFMTKNSGETWSPVNSGLTKKSILSLSGGGTSIFAGTTGGAFRTTSSDASLSWTAMNPTSMSKCIQSLAVMGTNIFAGTNGGLFLTTNNGSSWSLASSGLTDTTIYSLLIKGKSLFAGTRNGVYQSTNSGATWTPSNTGMTDMIVYSLATVGETIFAGTFYNGVFSSTDNGTTWRAATSGLKSDYINALAACETRLFAGTFNGVFASVDYGRSWKPFNEGLKDTLVLALTINGSSLFAGTHDAGVWRMPITDVAALPGHIRAPVRPGAAISAVSGGAGVGEIDFSIGQSDRVCLTLHDVTGRLVATIADGRFEAGEHRLPLAGKRLPRGCYTVKLRTTASTVAERFPLIY